MDKKILNHMYIENFAVKQNDVTLSEGAMDKFQLRNDHLVKIMINSFIEMKKAGLV